MLSILRLKVPLKLFGLLSFILFSGNVKSEHLLINAHTHYLTFSINDYYYIANKDSIYITKDELNWIRIKNPVEVDNFDKINFIGNNNFGYLYFQSGGSVYLVKDSSITKLSRDFEFQTHYGSSSFLNGDELNIFGGYGYFEYRNDILYFDKIKGGWEKKITLDRDIDLPSRRYNHFHIADSLGLYLFGGETINPKVKSSYLHSVTSKDAWRYSNVKNHWIYLGIMKNEYSHLDYDFIVHNDDILLIPSSKTSISNNSNLIFINLKTNLEKHYTQKNIAFMSDIPNNTGKSFNYNSNSKKFFFLINKHENLCSPVFMSDEDFLGDLVYESSAYTPAYYKTVVIWTILSILLLSGGLVYFKNRTKQNNIGIIEKINQLNGNLSQLLSEEENRIFQTILSMHPEPAPYPNLLACFEQTYGYESQIKRLRSSITNINTQLQITLKIRKTVLVQQKNVLDKRIKEIIINPDLKK